MMKFPYTYEECLPLIPPFVDRRCWLDVPFSKKNEARSLGARWDWGQYRWYAPSGTEKALRRWKGRPDISPILVGEDRTFGGPLFIDLVPQTCWRTNARSLLSEVDWERVKRMARLRTDRRCELCGDSPSKIDTHERWEFRATKTTRRQILRRLIALCPACHEATHMGLASVNGRAVEAMRHLRKIRKWTKRQTEIHEEEARALWVDRSSVYWTLDVSLLTRAGLKIADIPDRRARSRISDESVGPGYNMGGGPKDRQRFVSSLTPKIVFPPGSLADLIIKRTKKKSVKQKVKETNKKGRRS